MLNIANRTLFSCLTARCRRIIHWQIFHILLSYSKTRSRTKVSSFFLILDLSLPTFEVNSPKPLKSWRWFDISLTSLAPSWSHLWSLLTFVKKKEWAWVQRFTIAHVIFFSDKQKSWKNIYLLVEVLYFCKKKWTMIMQEIHAIRIFHYGCKFCRPQF